MIRTLLIFFKPHKFLFILDISCALMVAVIDLAFPLVSRHAMYEMLPNKSYGMFLF